MTLTAHQGSSSVLLAITRVYSSVTRLHSSSTRDTSTHEFVGRPYDVLLVSDSSLLVITRLAVLVVTRAHSYADESKRVNTSEHESTRTVTRQLLAMNSSLLAWCSRMKVVLVMHSRGPKGTSGDEL